jgi:iron(III) transport system ATP-binding protein
VSDPSDVTVVGLRKTFGGVPVLGGVDLHVPAGSLTVVLGPSGCGKTTLLRLIAGFDRPDAGMILFGGRPVCDVRHWLPPERRRVGYVAQEGALFPHLTVAGNIAFGLPWRERRDGRRVAELLALVGLDAGYVRRYPHELSGGQQQRVALARALAPRPGIVLLDEPFSSLDAGLREGTRMAVAQALKAAAATAILVTHDQAEALSLATQVAVMRDGRLAQIGPPAAVYQQPVDLAVATFLGDAVLLPAAVWQGVATCDLGRLPVRGATPDGRATLLIRPEQIAVTPAPTPDQCGRGAGAEADAAGLLAFVLDVSYYGRDATVRLTLQGSGTGIIARVPGHQAPTPGRRVRVRVLQDVAAFPAPDAVVTPALPARPLP